MSINLIGKKVTIKCNNEWGIIRAVHGESIYVAIFDDPTTTVLFYREEIRVQRGNK